MALPLSYFSVDDPQRTAVMIGDKEISYARFEKDIAAMSEWFLAQGVRRGHRVAVMSAMYRAWLLHLALLRIGTQLATLSVRHVNELAVLGVLDFLVDDSGRAAAVADPAITKLNPPRKSTAVEAAVGLDPWLKPDVVAEAEGRRLAMTSGTTGSPKIVPLSLSTIRERAERIASRHHFGADTRLIPMIGMSTAGGFHFPLAVWHKGGCVILPGRSAHDSNAQVLQVSASNVVKITPPSLYRVLGADKGKWPGWAQRRLIVPGGRLPIALRDEALRRFCSQITLNYGATETGTIASGDASVLDRHVGAVGYVVGNAQLEIVDESDQPVAVGQPGIVRTRSTVMIDAPAGGDGDGRETAFREGWFYPGDRGMLLDDGLLVIFGRDADTVNIGGIKLSLAELEEPARALKEVEDVCALSLNLAFGDRLAFAVVCAADVDLSALGKRICDAIPTALPPVTIMRVPSIPRNEMGKVPRLAFAEQISKQVNDHRLAHDAAKAASARR